MLRSLRVVGDGDGGDGAGAPAIELHLPEKLHARGTLRGAAVTLDDAKLAMRPLADGDDDYDPAPAAAAAAATPDRTPAVASATAPPPPPRAPTPPTPRWRAAARCAAASGSPSRRRAAARSAARSTWRRRGTGCGRSRTFSRGSSWAERLFRARPGARNSSSSLNPRSGHVANGACGEERRRRAGDGRRRRTYYMSSRRGARHMATSRTSMKGRIPASSGMASDHVHLSVPESRAGAFQINRVFSPPAARRAAAQPRGGE